MSFRKKFCDLIENAFDILWKILKWSIFPFCFILMCIKRLKWVFTQDIPWYYNTWVRSPILSWDGKLSLDTDRARDSLIFLIKRSFINPNDYLLKEIPSEWVDKPEVTSDLLFSCIIDFVEEEKCFESNEYFFNYSIEEAAKEFGVSATYIKEHQQLGYEIKRIYNYAKIAKEHPEKILEALKLLYKINKTEEEIKENIEFYELYPDSYYGLEEQINDLVLKRIINLRQNLWT